MSFIQFDIQLRIAKKCKENFNFSADFHFRSNLSPHPQRVRLLILDGDNNSRRIYYSSRVRDQNGGRTSL